MKEKILEYENRLLEDRRRLNELIQESTGEEREILKNKLFHLENELSYMNHQLQLLKREVYVQTQPVRPVIQAQQAYENQTGFPVQPGYTNQQACTAQPGYRQQSAHNMSPAQKDDMEKTVGKIIMGVFASVLIFISMILFATLVIPHLNDTVKIVLSYIVSFLFLGLGLFMLRKNEKNNFWLAFAGCGAGGIYISLLLSNVYYKVIGDIALFVLVAVWAGLMCCLSRLKSQLFKIIGHIGITIAVGFGLVLCMDTEDVAKFTALVVFYLITSGIFFITHFEKSFVKHKGYHLFNLINVFMLYLGSVQLFETGMNLVVFLLFLLVLGSMAVSFYADWQESNIGHGLIISGYGLLVMMVCGRMISANTAYSLIVYVIVVAVSVFAQLKKGRSNEGKYIIQVAMILLAHVINESMVLREDGYLLMITLPMVLAGFMLNNKIYKWGAVITFLFEVFELPAEVIDIIGGIALIVLMFVLLCRYKEHYAKWFKNAIYLATCLFIVIKLHDVVFYDINIDEREISGMIIYTLLAGFNLYMMKGRFSKNLKTGEWETNFVYSGVNFLIMVWGLVLINHLESTTLHLLAIMITIAVFLVNARRLLDKDQTILPGIYVGIKLTVLIVSILQSFDTVNYLVSITCFAVALVSIVTGFAAKYRSLRIYGLVLSMFSIFKLIMIDTHYTNTLGNAVSFFVSGVLCFAISLVYNYIDKKLIMNHAKGSNIEYNENNNENNNGNNNENN